jgi:hypothetical protein
MNRKPAVQSIARRYNDWVLPAHFIIQDVSKTFRGLQE